MSGGHLECLLRFPIPNAKRIWSITTCAIKTDTYLLAISTDASSTILLYTYTIHNCNEMVLVCKLDGREVHHGKTIRRLAFNTKKIVDEADFFNGRGHVLLAAAGYDGRISIWVISVKEDAMIRGYQLGILEGHENEVKDVAWSPSSIGTSEELYLATCGRDRTLWIWVMLGGGELDSDLKHFNDSSLSKPICSSDESVGGESCCMQGRSCCRQQSPAVSLPSDVEFECQAVLQEHSQDVKCLAWHPKIPLVATGSYDETVHLIQSTSAYYGGDGDEEWVLKNTINPEMGTIWSMAWAAQNDKDEDGHQVSSSLYLAGESGTVACYKVDSGKPQLAWSSANTGETLHHSGPVYSLDLDQNNALLAMSGQDRSIQVRDCNDGKVLAVHHLAHLADLNVVKWLDDKHLIVVSDDGSISVWRYS